MIILEKARPNTIAVESCTHIKPFGPPIVTSRVAKLISIANIIGSRPPIAVIVVRNTGRRRWALERITASIGSMPESRRRWNVSISTMLWFTTMPASASMPVPVMMIEKVWPITTMPSSAPIMARITATRIKARRDRSC